MDRRVAIIRFWLITTLLCVLSLADSMFAACVLPAFFWGGCPCCGCACSGCSGGVPCEWQVEFSGISQAGYPCMECSGVNGAYVLSYVGQGGDAPPCTSSSQCCLWAADPVMASVYWDGFVCSDGAVPIQLLVGRTGVVCVSSIHMIRVVLGGPFDQFWETDFGTTTFDCAGVSGVSLDYCSSTDTYCVTSTSTCTVTAL